VQLRQTLALWTLASRLPGERPLLETHGDILWTQQHSSGIRCGRRKISLSSTDCSRHWDHTVVIAAWERFVLALNMLTRMSRQSSKIADFWPLTNYLKFAFNKTILWVNYLWQIVGFSYPNPGMSGLKKRLAFRDPRILGLILYTISLWQKIKKK